MPGIWEAAEATERQGVAVDDRMMLFQKFCDVEQRFTEVRRDIEERQKMAEKLGAERDQLRHRILVELGVEPPSPPTSW